MSFVVKYRVPLLVAFILSVFAVIISVNTIRSVTIKPWWMNTDHIQFGSIVQKNLDPTILPTDYAFSTTRHTDFYTPTFINLLTTLTQQTGDYILSLALTQIPLIILYFPAMFLLYWWFTRSTPVAIIFTLLSVIGLAGFNSEWEVTGLRWMLPRTYALPALIVAYLMFLKIYKSPQNPLMQYRYWVVFGLLIGLVANFHPTTGMTMAIAVGSILLAYTIKNGKPGILRIVVLAVFTIIAGLPTIMHVVGNSNIGNEGEFQEASTEAFREFAEVFEWRIRTYPHTEDFGRGWTADSEEIQFLIRFPWLTLTLVGWFLLKREQRSLSALFFMAIQLVYLWLVIDNLDRTGIIILAGYSFYRWWNRDDDRLLFLYEIIAAILLIVVALPLIFRPLWLHFELWSLTTVVVELARVAKQVQIPVTLIWAMLAVDLWRRWQPMTGDRIWWRVLLVLAWILYARLFVVIGIAILLYDAFYDRIPRFVRYAGLAVATGVVFQQAYSIIVPYINRYRHFEELLIYQVNHYTILLGFLVGVAVWLVIRRISSDQVYTQVLGLTIGCVFAGLLQFASITTQVRQPEQFDNILEIADWAKSETPLDAIFSIYTNSDFERSLFRLHGQRNLYFSRKDLNIIGYAQPQDLLPQYERYVRLLDYDFSPPDAMRQYFEDEQVDYMIFRETELPENFEGQPYLEFGDLKVFKCPDDICET